MNLAIAWDFIQAGRREGDTIGSTGRYVESRGDTPGQKFYLATTENGGWDYYSYGRLTAQGDRIRLFASTTARSAAPVAPESLEGSRPAAVLADHEARPVAAECARAR